MRRVRTSAWILTAVFLIIAATYLLVRPSPAALVIVTPATTASPAATPTPASPVPVPTTSPSATTPRRTAQTKPAKPAAGTKPATSASAAAAPSGSAPVPVSSPSPVVTPATLATGGIP